MTEDEYPLRSYKVGDFFDDFFEGVVRGVDLGGSLGADERGCLAGSIHFVAGSNRVGLPLFSTASGACGLVGVEEKPVSGPGEDDGANIASFHYQASVLLLTSEVGKRTLIGEKFFSHFGDRGKFGYLCIHLGRAKIGVYRDYVVYTKPGTTAIDLSAELKCF